MIRAFIASLAVAGVPVCAFADVLEGFPDPTHPIGGEVRLPRAPESAPGELEATFVSRERKLALIGGRYVSVGDAVGSAVVAEIRAYEVVLTTRQGGSKVLRMMPRLEKPANGIGAKIVNSEMQK